jgi:S-adenosylmethionine:tRNA ribosyltransferase-isomerase
VRATDFDYALPEERIAQAPLPERDGARLFHLDRVGANSHRRVRDLPELLPPGALLVVNDTRVIKARVVGKKPTGGRVELLLCDPLGDGSWRCLGGASRPIRTGPLLVDGERPPRAEVLRVEGEWVDVQFEGDGDWLDRVGRVPLPPYIHRTADGGDEARYQTVFAREPGAVAAPTAGLHFSPELLAATEARGIRRATVTLHVGPGTFVPLRSDDVSAHVMHSERFVVPEATAGAVEETRAAGKPVIAVGTTVVRALEAHARGDSGKTRLFITPGFEFRAVDAMVTNFHLPKSTLLMLVAAFAGRARILAAYREAVEREYRFYSYGDAMLIK